MVSTPIPMTCSPSLNEKATENPSDGLQLPLVSEQSIEGSGGVDGTVEVSQMNPPLSLSF